MALDYKKLNQEKVLYKRKLTGLIVLDSEGKKKVTTASEYRRKCKSRKSRKKTTQNEKRILSIDDGSLPVSYPKQYSEFEVQSRVYQGLKARGYDARGEVSTKGARFDIVVFYKNKPLIIIEVKKDRRKDCAPQIRKYHKYCKQVRLIRSMEQAERFLESIPTRKAWEEKCHNRLGTVERNQSNALTDIAKKGVPNVPESTT